jgi:hypothetical protein
LGVFTCDEVYPGYLLHKLATYTQHSAVEEALAAIFEKSLETGVVCGLSFLFYRLANLFQLKLYQVVVFGD